MLASHAYMMALCMWWFALISALVPAKVVARGIVERCLGVNNRLEDVFVHFDSEASLCIDDLPPSKSYEIKVSVHSVPADFSFQLVHYPSTHAGPDKDLPGPASTRLDVSDSSPKPVFHAVEKLVLHTDSSGNITYSPSSSVHVHIPSGAAWLLVSARLRSPVLAGHAVPQGVQFDLRIDPLLAGVLPSTALPMLAWAACSVLLAAGVATALWTRLLRPAASTSAAALAGRKDRSS